MISLLLQKIGTLIGLGLIGFDFAGPAIVATAAAEKISKAKVTLFTLVSVHHRIALGVIFSLLGQQVVSQFQSKIPNSTSAIWAYINLIIAFFVMIWLFNSINKKDRKANYKKQYNLSSIKSWQVFGLGVLFALTLLTSPVFYATVAISAQTNSIVEILLIQILWNVFTQIPLIMATLTYVSGVKFPIIEALDKFWKKIKKSTTRILYVVVLVIVISLIVNSVNYFMNGKYIF